MAVLRGSAAISNDSPGIVEISDTFDRPGKASAEGTCAGTDTYAVGLKNKPDVKAGAAISCGASGILKMIDTFDRPGKAFAKGTYAGTNKYAVGLEDEHGKRIPKAGVSASAGVGHARAEWSICDAEAKGPNASAGVGASAGTLSASAFARAELCSASASAGPLRATAVVKAGAAISCGASGLVEMIDTFDRPGKAFAKGTYAGTNKYAVGLEDKPGKRIPKAGVSASAGVGHARGEWSIFEAEAKGPNASAGVGASAGTLSASAFARAEVASASASAGPLKATVGLSVDTGVSVGAGLEAKLLGCGFSVGRKMGVFLFGNGIEFNL
ncbi:uncharacterized protein LOC117562425 [Gymnodraco acuticeps]|uniref:Uncharacterized protein LOC117562425 n=1 Tax=Gymnodraco acuticeps TaxID=8218 RepID=A0A6P8VY57_GYMAC|nr:uncharacterized protein LOC117562425 [Gymnodraco acuticeps]XP_034096156.1 uncharacterized protein LOC117562425 [Gymnodraco acuticeps]